MNTMDISQHATGEKSGKEPFPISILSLTVGAFAIGMTEFVIMGILPNVADDLNVSIASAGQLITMYALGVAVGAPILTVLTNQIPQKKLLLLLMGLFILGNGISVFAPNYAVLMGARMLTALTHGTFFGVGAVIASNLVRPDKRAGAVSIMMAGLTIANIIGVPIGTFIGQTMGWRASFGAIAVMGVLALIGILIFIPNIRQEQATSIVQQITAIVRPQLLLFLLIGALGNAGLFAVFTYIAPLLIEITGFAEPSVTWILILFGIGVTIGNIVGGRLADWKLLPSILGVYFATAVILTILTVTHPSPGHGCADHRAVGSRLFRRYAGNAGARDESGPIRSCTGLHSNPFRGQPRKCSGRFYRGIGHYASKLNGPALGGRRFGSTRLHSGSSLLYV